MISCPSCDNKELTGALFCSQCGGQLISSNLDLSTNTIEAEIIEKVNSLSIPDFPPPPLDAADSKVALHILFDGAIIHIQGRNEFTIGRSTKGQTIIPDIDLSSYQAYESGVSRLHANINIQGDRVTINDLGSANGTRLNGERVDPHIEHLIKHGDILTFGQFKVQILLDL